MGVDNLVTRVSMCSFQFRFWSLIDPKYLACSHFWMWSDFFDLFSHWLLQRSTTISSSFFLLFKLNCLRLVVFFSSLIFFKEYVSVAYRNFSCSYLPTGRTSFELFFEVQCSYLIFVHEWKAILKLIFAAVGKNWLLNRFFIPYLHFIFH